MKSKPSQRFWRASQPLTILLIFLLMTGCLFEPFSPENGGSPTAVPSVNSEETPAESAAAPTPIPIIETELPPETATPLPSPTATADPDLPKWTVLVYMAADNDLDSQAIFNLNQLEVSGSTRDVNVIVQIDRAENAEWSGGRRYFVTQDDNPQQISSQLLEELGEINTGEAQTLTDFLLWGQTAYPAQNTALILWNHGIGWSGIATDETDRNILTLPELEQALETAAADPTTQNALAFVGFDACLMGQLDVYAALAPFAQVAVASEELTPAQGWPYDIWLQSLAANPTQSAADLGRKTVEQFNATYNFTHPFSTMAAVDLTRVDRVVSELQAIIFLTEDDLSVAAADLSLARSGAEQFARAYGIETDRFAAVDLGHMSKLLKAQAVDDKLRQAAETLEQAVTEAVIATGSGRGFANASGIALYFPINREGIDPRYEVQGRLPSWSNLLPKVIDQNASDLPLPSITIASDSLNQTAGVLNPLYLEFQITGRQIEAVNLIAGRYEADTGRRLLLEIDPLRPEPTFLADGSQSFQWRDGLHEDFYIWSTKVTYLSDGSSGQFVIMWPLDTQNPATNLRSVGGTYFESASGQSWRANLVFDTETRQIQQAWATGGGGAPYEFSTRAGDQFQPDRYYLDENDNLITEAGNLLVFNEVGQLSYTWEPVERGSYFIGFEVRNAAGSAPKNLIDINIENPDDPPPWQAYLDPYLGFQFLYPADWYRPVYSGDRLFTTSVDGSSSLQIIVFPDMANPSAEQLKNETLASFGLNNGNILYRDTMTIDNRPAERIAYSYFGADGQRVGELTAFVREGVGYVIDLDGPAENESDTVDIWNRLIENWAYLPVGRGLFPNRWATLELADLAVIQPETFVYEPASGGWDRFSLPEDSRIFMALHVDQLVNDETPTLFLDRWTGIAQSGIDQFTVFDPATRRFALGGRLWFRRDFSYVDGSGETIWGFLMVTQEGEKLITAWIESPQIRYSETEAAVFEVMLAELQTLGR